MLRRLNRYVLAHAQGVIAVVLVVSLLLGTQLPKLEFATDVDEFLPDSDVVEDNEQVQEYFGSANKITFIYLTPRGPNTNTVSLAAMRETYNLTRAIEPHHDEFGIVNSISLAQLVNLALAENNSDILDPSLEWPTIRNLLLTGASKNVSIEDAIYLLELLLPRNRDLKPFTGVEAHLAQAPIAPSTLLIYEIDGNLSTAQRKVLNNKLRDFVEDYNGGQKTIHAEVASIDLLAYDVDENTSQTNLLIAIGMFGVTVFVLFWAFRSASYVILPLFTLVLALVWTFGIMAGMGIAFTAIHVAVLPLVMGLGIDYAVHICRRYQEELVGGAKVKEALLASTDNVGYALFLSATTTSIAFLSNITAGVSPVRNFGLLAALGISFVFLLTLTFHTALRYLLDTGQLPLGDFLRSRPHKQVRSTPTLDRALGLVCTKVERYPLHIMLVVGVITLASFWGAMQVDSQFSLDDFLSDDLPLMVTLSSVQADYLGATYSQSFIMVEGDVATPQYLHDLDTLTEHLTNDELVLHPDSSEPRVDSILTLTQEAMDWTDDQSDHNFKVRSQQVYYLTWETQSSKKYTAEIIWYDDNDKELSRTMVFNGTGSNQEQKVYESGVAGVEFAQAPDQAARAQVNFRYLFTSEPFPIYFDWEVEWLEVYHQDADGPLVFTSSFFHTFTLTADGLPQPGATSEDIKALYCYLLDLDEPRDSFSNVTFAQSAEGLIHSKADETIFDVGLVRVYIGTTDQKAKWPPNNKQLEKLHDDLKDDVKGLFVDQEVSITGGYILTTVTINALQSAQFYSTLLAVLLAFGLLVLIYRNVGLGLVAIFPLLLVTVWILATMALLDITLNVMTVMVTALTIGLGIDYAIHIIERYREERKRHDKLESITETIEHTGSALVISALTTIAGFGVLALSPMPLVRNFGIITAATILYALLVAIFILPIMLMFIGRMNGTTFGGLLGARGGVPEPTGGRPDPKANARGRNEPKARTDPIAKEKTIKYQSSRRPRR